MPTNIQIEHYFKKHRLSDLKMIAKILNISGYSNKNKKDLVDLIMSHYLQYDEIETHGHKLLEISRMLKAYVPDEKQYEPNHIVKLKRKK